PRGGGSYATGGVAAAAGPLRVALRRACGRLGGAAGGVVAALVRAALRRSGRGRPRAAPVRQPGLRSALPRPRLLDDGIRREPARCHGRRAARVLGTRDRLPVASRRDRAPVRACLQVRAPRVRVTGRGGTRSGALGDTGSASAGGAGCVTQRVV